MMPNRHNLAKPDTSQPAENTEISTACELITRDYLGRPVDVAQLRDGSILVSDDLAGAIYRISYDK
jgi:glucose/arabinose dehydrogenase